MVNQPGTYDGPMTKPFVVEVQYTIQITQKEAEELVAQHREHPNAYMLAETLEEAIAWRRCNIVDAVVADTDDAAEAFLEAMGVEEDA